MKRKTDDRPGVVVVNDSATQLGILCQLVRQANAEPLPFTSAEDALAAMGAQMLPDLIVTDLHMSGVDGWRFCRLLHSPEYPTLNQIPILVVSATFAGEEPARIAADLGAQAFLSFTGDGAAFVKQVRAILRGDSQRPSLRALIVEDSKSLARLLTMALTGEGYEVDVATSIQAATTACRAAPYEVAILDYHLPDGKGDSVLDAMRVGQPDCVCLMMTGDPNPALCLDWMKRGAAAYLRKPFPLAYLSEMCARARRERFLLRAQDLLEVRTRELRQSEERYRLLVETANEGIWAMDADQVTNYANQMMADMLGYDRADLLGRGVEEFLFPEDMADHAQRMEGRRTGQDETYEGRFRRGDGSPLWALVSAKATQDDNGQYSGAFGMFADITARKQVEAVQEARLQILDRASSCTMEELLQVTLDRVETLTGSQMGFYHFVEPDQITLSLQAWSTNTTQRMCHARAAGRHYPIAQAGVWADCIRQRRPVIHNDYASLPGRRGFPEGHAPVVRELVVPVIRGSAVVGVLGVGNKPTDYTEHDVQTVASLADLAWDIVASKRSEEALRGREANFHAFFESMTDMIVVVNREGRILATNPALHRRLGYGAEELHGMAIVDLHPAELHEEAEALHAAILCEARDTCSLPLLAKDGGKVPVKAHWWFGKWNGQDCVFTAARDLTTEREARQSFLRLFQTNPTPMALSCADDGCFHDVNGAFLATTGYARQEVIGLSTADLGFFVDAEAQRHAARKLRTTGHIQDVELQILCKDGSTKDGLFFGEIIKEQGTDYLLTLMVDITERKLWETRLRQNEERLQSLFRASPAGIGVVKDRVFSRVNRKVCEMTGYKAQELVGQSARMLYPTQEDYELVGREKYRQIQESGTGAVETRWQHKDGTVIEILLASTPLAMSDLSQGVTFAALDITKRKRAEELLQLSEHRLRVFMNASPDMCFLKDCDLRYLLLNSANAAFLGLPESDILGKADADLMPREMAEACAASDRRAMREKRTVISVEEAGGRHYETRKLPVMIAGELGGVAGIVRDITESREVEQALRQFRTVFDMASFGVVTTDMAGVMTYVNSSFAAAHGYRPAQLLGQPVSMLHTAEQSDSVERLRWELTEKGSFSAQEVGQCRRDGAEFTMLMVGTVVRDDDGMPHSIVSTAVDITERKLLEAQLQQTRKMESVGRLAGSVAHDFNNMLGAILGYVELALGQVDPSQPVFADLLEIQGAAEHSADLTRQLLAFSRKQTITPKVLDLNETVECMLNMLRRLIGEDVELLWHPVPGTLPTKMDPTQIDQILVNLCINAKDAIANVGNITIETGSVDLDSAHCTSRPEVLPGNYVLLVVRDTGCGMSAETLERLFEPFFTTKEEGRGTGLGLATVYGIVKQNDGFIEVASEIGKGSSFSVYLPRHRGAVEVPEAGSDGAAAGGQETILLVEDEPAILGMTTTILGRLGYTVLSASTPGEAIRLAQEHPGVIHLLLTDVIMPEMNGRDLARDLVACRPGLTCLYMSGYTADIIARHGVLEDGIHFIRKPFYVKELAAKVREVLGAPPPSLGGPEDAD